MMIQVTASVAKRNIRRRAIKRDLHARLAKVCEQLSSQLSMSSKKIAELKAAIDQIGEWRHSRWRESSE